MGNSNSSAWAAQYGGVFIQLNNMVLVPSETVSGTIYLNLLQDYPGNTLYISIVGSEQVHYVDKEARHRQGRDGRQETYWIDVHRRDSASVINRSFPVYNWGG